MTPTLGQTPCRYRFGFTHVWRLALHTIIALKRAPEKVGMLKGLYEEEFQRALSQDEDRASFRIAPDLRNYNSA